MAVKPKKKEIFNKNRRLAWIFNQYEKIISIFALYTFGIIGLGLTK